MASIPNWEGLVSWAWAAYRGQGRGAVAIADDTVFYVPLAHLRSRPKVVAAVADYDPASEVVLLYVSSGDFERLRSAVTDSSEVEFAHEGWVVVVRHFPASRLVALAAEHQGTP